MTSPDPVKAGIAALNKLLSAGAIESDEQLALDWLEQTVGAKRSLASYAPRTRRRYIAAARKGQSATQVNKDEYAGRTWRIRMEKLFKKRNEYMPDSIVDWDVVNNFVDAFGYKHVETILRNELDSIEQYVYHNKKEPGNARWHHREHEIYKPNFNERLASTDVLYYYHGVRL